jgi:DNA repair protein RecO (recombination protein O)
MCGINTLMNTFTAEAFVLKNTNFKDYDKIYTLLSKDHSLFSLLAKGVRKSGSRRSASLDTLNLVSVSVRKSDSSDLNYLGEVKILNTFASIKLNLEKSKRAFTLAELALKSATPGQDTRQVFEVLKQGLTKLNDCADTLSEMNVATLKTELKILEVLGYGLNLEDLKRRAGTFENMQKLIASHISEIIGVKFKSKDL